MRFSKMHFRNVKRALLIFTPSEMHLQRVNKNKILKNSLRQEVANSPQPFSSSCSSLFFLYSIGGMWVLAGMFGILLGIRGALTDRNHG